MGDSPASSTPGGTPRLLSARSRQSGAYSVSSDVPTVDELVIPRHEWISRLMRQHPDVLGLRERLRQVLGLTSFSAMASDVSSRTEIPDTVDPDLVICLVDQFLREFGFDEASETLRMESSAFTTSNPAVFGEDLRLGDLQNLVRIGITPTLFSHTTPNSDDPDPELEAVSEDASTPAVHDVNIWSEPSTIVTSSSMAQANYLNMSTHSFGGGAPKNLIFETLHHHHSHAAQSGTGILNGEDGLEPDLGSQTHVVKAATFNQLVLWLLSTDSDSHFRRVFFGTLFSFATPQQFITKIEQRYTTPAGLPKLDQLELFSIANTMTHWVSTYGHEFSYRTYSLLSKFVENTFIRDGHHHIAESLQNVIAKAFLNRQSRRAPPSIRAQEMLNSSDTTSMLTSSGSPSVTTGSSSLPTSSTPLSAVLASGDTSSSPGYAPPNDLRRPLHGFPEPKIPKNIFELSLTLDDVDEEEIARQFTCLDSETFHRVKTQELFKNAWLKNRGRKAKRVVLLLNASNALSKWVLDSITNATGSSGSSSSGASTATGGTSSNPNTGASGVSGSGSAANLSGASGMSGGTGMGGVGSASSAGLMAAASNASSDLPSGISSSNMSSKVSDGLFGGVGGANTSEQTGGAAGDGDGDGDSASFSYASDKSSCISSVLTQKANSQLQHHTLSGQVTQENPKRITRTIAKWIKIAEHLRALNNFHSLLAIWVALRSRYVYSAIALLRKEFPKSILDTLNALDQLFSQEDSYANYRAVTSEITSQPTIPAFIINLRDVALVEEVHNDFARSGKSVINFRKRRLLFSATQNILRHQQNKHNLLQVYQVSDRIQTSLIVSFEALQADKPGGHYDYASW